MRLHVNVELSTRNLQQDSHRDLHAKFKRANGWVVVGKDELRDLEKANDYPSVADRRAVS